MKTISPVSPASLFVLVLASCTAGPADLTETAEPSAVAASSALEAAMHDVDRGVSLAAARSTIEAALQQNAVTGEARDDAELALAVACEGLDDHEHAVSTLEATMARHGRSNWARQQDANRLLVRWLTGTDRPATRSRSDSSALPVAPVAHALARTIPRSSKERVDIAIARFGGDETSEMLGTFRIDGALRQDAEVECPLCDRDLSTHTSSSGYVDWTGVAVEAEDFGKTLAVFYYDQEAGKIPARYDAYLPMPSAAIEARLQDGKGFYAVKERPGAPAIVLFAAPRRAQLASVESAFAVQTELPKEPVTVNVPKGLLPREIKAAMRARFGAFRACYEALAEPRPAGTFELAFAIDGDGKVQSASSANGTTMRAPGFERCMLDGARSVEFPALGGAGETTVRYPIAFQPD